ncbi:MAG TPA: DUF72 domain-containing protein [Thermosynechococcaceae cyanobacterium]
MNFRLGCAIWAYKGWLGDVFPAGSRSTDFLKLYSQRFTTVEGNTTFYSVPDARTVRRWREETPEGFQFCLKLPKTLTHAGLLQPQISEAQRFVAQMGELGDRLGPMFAQLPPSYDPTQMPDLQAFLAGLPRNAAEFALEVRHPDWFKEPHRQRLNDLLAELGLGRVLLDTRPTYDAPDNPEVQSERRKPRVPSQPIVTAPFALIRYISHPDLEFNQPYLEEWAKLVDQWLQQGTRVYFFVHCPLEERSPTNARQFQHLLEQLNPQVPPLPWQQLKPEQLEQLKLF